MLVAETGTESKHLQCLRKKNPQQITTSCLRQTFREGVNLLDYYAYKGEEGVILLPSPSPISSVNFSEADIAHSKLLEVSNIFFFDLCVSFKQMYVTKYIFKKLPKTRAAVGISLDFIRQVHSVVFSWNAE